MADVRYRYGVISPEDQKLLNLAKQIGYEKAINLLQNVIHAKVDVDDTSTSDEILNLIKNLESRITALEDAKDITDSTGLPLGVNYSVTQFWGSSYFEFCKAITVINDENKSVFKNMWKILWSKRGTPQSPVSWKDSSFIDKYLSKKEMYKENTLAWKLWNIGINPRYSDWIISFVEKEGFLKVENDVFIVTDSGKRFLQNNEKELKIFLERQGFIKILELIKKHKIYDKNKIINEWVKWVNEVTGKKWKKPSWINPSFNGRLKFLTSLGYLEKKGYKYYITLKGENI